MQYTKHLAVDQVKFSIKMWNLGVSVEKKF